MDTTQKEWLAKLGGQAKAVEAIDAFLQQRDQIRSQLEFDISRAAKALRKRMDMEVEDEAGNTQRLLDYDNLDQTAEFDHDDQQDGYTLREGDLRTHLQAADLVTTLSTSLDVVGNRPKFDEDGNPVLDEHGEPEMEEARLFSEDQLGEEFYMPLVRQGLLPETFVPTEHSQTHAMLEGAFTAYKERLDADAVSDGWERFRKENMGLFKEMANLGVAAASSAISYEGIKNLSEDDINAEGLSSYDSGSEGVMKWTEMGWDLATDKIPAAVEDIRGNTPPARVNQVRNAAKTGTLLVAAVSEAAGKALKPWQLDVTAPAVLTAQTDATKIATHLAAAELNDAEVNGIVTELKKGLSALFTTCDPGVEGSAPTVQAALNAANNAIQSEVKAATVLQLCAENPPNYPKVIQHVGGAATAAMTAALGVEAFKDLLENDDNKKKTKEKLGAKITQALEEDQQAAREESQKELAALERDGDVSKKAGMLEKRIAEMEKDEKLIRWTADIGGLGFEAASAFLAPMAIAGSAAKLAMLTKKAIERTKDFNTWAKEKQELLHAASPYSAPVANFVSNADSQSRHLLMQQAAEFCNLVGLVIETVGMCTGPAALLTVTVGKSVQLGAKIASSVENVLNELAKRYDLEKAWQTYREALLRPENRKLGLIAIKKNPTLAKYAVAWGAVIKKDPLVSDFMASCGLDAETLEDPKTNLANVVTYLEKRMSDDIEVVGRNPGSSPWEPNEVTLTVGCWMGTIARAEKDAKLVPSDTSRLQADLIRFEAQFKALGENFKPDATPPVFPDEEALSAAQRTLAEIGSGLKSYTPLLQESETTTIPHVAMQKATKRFQQAHAGFGARLEKMKAPAPTPPTAE